MENPARGPGAICRQWLVGGGRGRDRGCKEVVEELGVQEALEEAAAEPRGMGSVL